MNANQFLLMIACMLCLALGAIALSQVSQDSEAPISVQVIETTPTPADTTDGIRL